MDPSLRVERSRSPQDACRANSRRSKTDISTDEFLRIVKDALRLAGRGGKLPCTLLVLDEVQQYIGHSTIARSLSPKWSRLISKQLDARSWSSAPARAR